MPRMYERHAVVLGSVFILAFLLHPDLFGLIPNSLDPMFYTGYAINLGDALAAAGNHHYFVTRWSSYLPQYVSCQIFGPFWGRLLLRLVLISIIYEVFWRIGRQLRFSGVVRTVSFLVVILMPMFVRAFTTDYQEYSSTVYGILLVALVLTQPLTKKWSLSFGALAALAMISNPFNIAITAICLIAWIPSELKLRGLKNLCLQTLVGIVGGSAVLSIGYCIFAYYFKIGNVYEPTINFIRSYKAPQIDLWTTSGHPWLGYFGWLSIPALLVIFSRLLVRVEKVESITVIRKLEWIVSLVFTYHAFTQYRSGHSLETGFYWAMALPPVYLLMFLVIGSSLTKNAKTTAMSIALFLGLVCSIKFEFLQNVKIPHGINLYVWVLFFVGVVVVLAHYKPMFVTPALVIGILWLQVGSPSYTTLTRGGDSNTPRYDLVYGEHSEVSRQTLGETIWFVQQMDRISDDWKSTFLSAGGKSASIIGTYIPHPFGRWYTPLSESAPLTPNVRDEIEFESRKYLVVFGDRYEVARLLPGITQQLPRMKIVLDETHRKDLGYRLIVISGNTSDYGIATLPMSRFDHNIGTNNADGSISVPALSPDGYASFGPYIALSPGKYVATIHYESAERGRLGFFEVFSDAKSKGIKTRISVEKPGLLSSSLNFVVDRSDVSWQFRTEFHGRISARFVSVTLERVLRDE